MSFDQTPPYRRLPCNNRGRDFVIGDIHGHFRRVERELERIAFDPRRDRLICVGDLVDRGPESERAADWLAHDWFFAVMGNHDASVLQRCGLLSTKFELWHDYHDWLRALDAASRDKLRDSLAALPWALEIGTTSGPVGIVHAEVPERFDNWNSFLDQLEQDQVKSLAVSARDLARRSEDLGSSAAHDEAPLPGIRWVIHGHTPRRHCRPGQLGNRLWIDTMGWYDAPLQSGEPRFTIVDIEDPLTPL